MPRRSFYNDTKTLAVIAGQKGINNGIASLDSNGKIPSSQLTVDVLEYKGTWNASTNTPTLADGTGNTGDLYRVSVAGTQDLGSGSIIFEVGDYVVYNGATWEKWDNASLAIGDDITSGTAKNVLFIGTGGVLAQDDHFYYDSATDQLHVHSISGDATDGLKINSDNGTPIGVLGAANTANVTWYGNHNFDAQTANTIAIFGASKTLSSADTATYPSLTELAYVKGVTSAIQTQLDGKASSSASLTIGSTNIALGGTATTIAGLSSVTSTAFVGALTGNASTATSLATSRNLWGQAFNGAADVTGSLTSVGDITGGASSMTITAGTGNSRTLTLRTTTSGGTAATAVVIDNAQKVLLNGMTTARVALGLTPSLQIEASTTYSTLGIFANANDATSIPALILGRSRGTSAGSFTANTDGDRVGGIFFTAADGDSLNSLASIEAYAMGAQGSNDTPGMLAFFTAADGTSTLTERMRIENDGRVGIGTNDPATVLHLFRGSGETFRITNTAGAGFYCETRSSASSSDIGFATLGTGKLILRAGGDTFQITSANAYFPTIGTTASAANAYLNSGSTPANELLRSTSSRVYKRDIEDMDDEYADNILKLRPVWYRSKCENDPADHSYWGFIAEEVAEIDPRLVQWGYHNDDWEEEIVDEDGKQIKPRTLKDGAVKKPDGVTYDRLSVLIVDYIQRLENRVRELETHIA